MEMRGGWCVREEMLREIKCSSTVVWCVISGKQASAWTSAN